MKNKFHITLLLKTILLASGIAISSSGYAVICTVDSAGNVTTNCDTTLTINSGNTNSTINIQANITTVGGDYGIFINSTSNVLNTLNINSNETISANASAISNQSASTLSALVNSGHIVSSNGNGISSAGRVITSITNNSSGVIETTSNAGSGSAIVNSSLATIGTITNYGIIKSASGTNRVAAISNLATIGTITNYGSISGSYLDIKNTNSGTIGVINNAQGAFNSPSSTSLTLWGTLPSNYNVIITPTSYGTFSARDSNGTTYAAGATSFGVYAGSQIAKSTYASVLDGLGSFNLTTTTGKYQGMTWTLTPNSTLYDLVFSGTNTAVMSALNQTATALQNVFTLQNSVLVNGFTYDCPVFDKNNICVSVGGRYSTANTESVNSTGGLLIGAYRLSNQVRLGAYIDQNVSTNSTGIVKVGNASPMVGVFGAWNERLDGTGTEVKLSAGYGQKNTTMNRQVVDGSEAGAGSSTLNTQGVQAIGKYGFAVAEKTIISPYVGLRYTQNNMSGYTEGSSAAVTAPLTYSAVNTNATTLVAGLGANYKVMPDVALLASAGLENDLNTSNGNYTATGLYGLNSINFNSNPVRTRATATLGAYYDLAKNQRVGINGIYRQEPYQGVSTTSILATYTIGL